MPLRITRSLDYLFARFGIKSPRVVGELQEIVQPVTLALPTLDDIARLIRGVDEGFRWSTAVDVVNPAALSTLISVTVDRGLYWIQAGVAMSINAGFRGDIRLLSGATELERFVFQGGANTNFLPYLYMVVESDGSAIAIRNLDAIAGSTLTASIATVRLAELG